MRGVHGSFLDKDSVSVSDSASDSFFHMLKWGYFWGGGGGGCSAFAQGKGHWIGHSCGELQTPHPKGALPLEISLLFIWITGAEMRKGGLMNSRLPGMCKRSLQVCREQLQDCWIIACHSLPSSQFGYIGLLNLWKTDALMHNTHDVPKHDLMI